MTIEITTTWVPPKCKQYLEQVQVFPGYQRLTTAQALALAAAKLHDGNPSQWEGFSEEDRVRLTVSHLRSFVNTNKIWEAMMQDQEAVVEFNPEGETHMLYCFELASAAAIERLWPSAGITEALPSLD